MNGIFDTIEGMSQDEINKQLVLSGERRNMFSSVYKFYMLIKQQQVVSSEIQRQVFHQQGMSYDMPTKRIPYNDKLPGLFCAVYLRCLNDYKCKGCRKINKCFSGAVSIVVNRLSKKKKADINAVEIFHESNMVMDDINKAIVKTMREVFLSWGQDN